MPDTKITALAAITTVDPAADVLPIVDISDTSMAASGTTKKITSNQILGAGGTATLASATITGDLTVDTSTLKVDSANNRVGIVTASPADFLEVVGSGANGIRVSRSGQPTQFATLSAGATGPTLNASSAIGELSFGIAGTSAVAMTLNSTGLGVGVVPSAGKLHVKGAAFQNPLVLDTLGFNQIILQVNGVNRGQINADATNCFGVVDSTNSFTRFVVTDTGNVGIGVAPSAGKGCLQLVSGINFPATQVASSDANTLDDYEEGSFVPTLNSGTFSSASCRYTKIGNMVTIFFDVTVGTGGGDRITNLPFAAASTSTVASGIYTNNQTYAAGTTAPVVVVGGSSSTLFFRTVGTGVAFSAMTLTAAANLTGSISYFV